MGIIKRFERRGADSDLADRVSAIEGVNVTQSSQISAFLSLVPSGAVLEWPGTVAPSGWLILNGWDPLRADVPNLWSMAQASGNIVTDAMWWAGISGNPRYYRGSFSSGNGSTTLRLPDRRGMFSRGLDGGAGVDTGRAIGTVQLFQMQSHSHTLVSLKNSGSSAAENYYPINASSSNSGISYSTIAIANTGGNETRPTNTATNYIIKIY